MADRKDDDRVHIALPPGIFITIIGGALLAGAGGGSYLRPSMDNQALQACFDNSRTAISVAEQHGEEHVNFIREHQRIEERIAIVVQQMLERTSDRYSGTDAERAWREHLRIEATQDRRILALERLIDELQEAMDRHEDHP